MIYSRRYSIHHRVTYSRNVQQHQETRRVEDRQGADSGKLQSMQLSGDRIIDSIRAVVVTD